MSDFGEVKTTKLPEGVVKVALDEAGKIKLEALNKAPSDSKSSNKSRNTSWVRHFIFGIEEGSGVWGHVILLTLIMERSTKWS